MSDFTSEDRVLLQAIAKVIVPNADTLIAQSSGGLMGGANSGTPWVPPSPPPPSPLDLAETAYWNSRPSYIQALRKITDHSARLAQANRLALAGFSVDPAIEVDLNNPYTIMKQRINYGYTWVPAIGQNVPLVPPDNHFPGQPDYDPNNPPLGSIIVSLDFAKGIIGL